MYDSKILKILIYIYIYICVCVCVCVCVVGRTFVSAPNQVLFALGWVRIDLRLTRTNLLNPTSGRDASHSCLISLWPKDECTTTTHVK